MDLFKKDAKGGSFNARVTWLFAFFLLLALTTVVRLVYLQILSHDDLSAKAEDQREFSSVLKAERGKIFLIDKFGNSSQLATNGSEYLVYAVPKDIENKEDFAKKISELLGVDYEVLLARVSKEEDPYEPIKQTITEEQKIEVDKLGLSGIGFRESKGRIYPSGALASHVSGFLSTKKAKGIGQYGIEEFYNTELSGKEGFVSGQKDSLGTNIIDENAQSFLAIGGDYIFLSLDPNVQFKIEDELKKAVEKWNAESGSVIVMETSTGRILGMANYPNFDPNRYSSIDDIDVFRNKSVSSQYEPGSVIKPITMAMGIDEGVITENTKYEDKGFLSISGYTIRNYDGKVHGENTMTEVLVKSLNTGTVFVAEKIPKDKFLEYIQNFGFGTKTGVDLPVEAKGDIRNLVTQREINFATASFGQGIAVTPLQMISAISAIANDGVLVKPHVVDQIFHANGSKEYVESEEVRRVISEETAETVQKMLVSVVENGFDRAKIPGYFVAGKTGTAQIPSSDGKGYSEETIHSFVGFAPAYDSRFSLLMKLEKPQDIRFASETLTTPFRDIMTYLLNYYEVTPDF